MKYRPAVTVRSYFLTEERGRYAIQIVQFSRCELTVTHHSIVLIYSPNFSYSPLKKEFLYISKGFLKRVIRHFALLAYIYLFEGDNSVIELV